VAWFFSEQLNLSSTRDQTSSSWAEVASILGQPKHCHTWKTELSASKLQWGLFKSPERCNICWTTVCFTPHRRCLIIYPYLEVFNHLKPQFPIHLKLWNLIYIIISVQDHALEIQILISSKPWHKMNILAFPHNLKKNGFQI